MKRQRGVSLTEMLVCLVIIAILVGLLSPVFAKTKASAKQVGDVSNMRQIYAALQLYKADNDGYPLRTERTLFFNQYLQGTKLQCTSGVPRPGDYHILDVNNSLINPGSIDLFKKYEECRNQRGSSFPLIQDMNHMTDVAKYATGEAYLLILREHGGIERMTESQHRSVTDIHKYDLWPCQLGKYNFIDLIL